MEIIDEKRGKNTAKNGSFLNTWTDLQEATFVIFINYASALVGKQRYSTSNKEEKRLTRLTKGRKKLTKMSLIVDTRQSQKP